MRKKMVSTSNNLFTTQDREDNPKAVFFGTESDLINPLANHLSINSVDLYAGKVLTDAFYGNYFFYIGPQVTVKNFLAESGTKLPKTLLILTQISDILELEKILNKFSQVKVITVSKDFTIDEKKTVKIIDFFFASEEKILNLGRNIVSDSNMEINKIIPQENHVKEKVDEEKKDEQKQETKKPAELTIPEKNNKELKQKIEKLYRENPNSTGLDTENESLDTKKNDEKKSRHKWIKLRTNVLVAFFSGLIIFIIFPILLFLFETTFFIFFAYQTNNAIKTHDLKKIEANLSSSKFYLNALKNNLVTSRGIFKILQQEKLYQQLTDLSEVAQKLTQGGLYLVQVAREGQNLLSGISKQEKGTSFGQIISASRINLVLADNEFAVAQASLKNESLMKFFNTPVLTKTFPQLKKLSDLITNTRGNIEILKNSAIIAPELLGIDGERKYLLIFQNNMELRPTGGFIGSFGLVSFTNGVLKDFDIQDVYAADGALKGHVDPPLPIRTHLGQEHWYLRDSNWNPDFSTSAVRIIWFLEKELGINVDGVIAVDLTFLEYLLQGLGPIELSDYNEKITSDNIFLKAQTQAEKDFFPGSTQKRDFLGAVGRQLINELIQEKNGVKPEMINVIRRSLDEKHMLLFFNSASAQTVVNTLGWAGVLKNNTPCLEEGCVADFIMIVDANLGVNKSNYFIKRDIEVNITLTDDGKITHTLTTHYKNNSPKEEDFIGGGYKNYSRLITPSNSRLTSAAIDNTPLNLTNDLVASSSSVVANEEENGKVIASLIEVAPQEEKVLSVSYDQSLNMIPPSSYIFTIQKQPGTLADNIKVNFVYPANWNLLQPDSSSDVFGVSTVVTTGQITYNTTLSRDQTIKLKFGK